MRIKAFLLLFYAFTICSGAKAEPVPVNLTRFEDSIRAFEAQDRRNPPHKGGTLFVGSSTFALWGLDLEKEFQDFQALNRGFGGSTIPEINYYSPRMVIPYQPRLIVFYAGTNDIADDHSPQQILQDFQTFAKQTRAALPKVKIAFISMSIPPSRVRWESNYRTANDLIKAYAGAQPDMLYIDVSNCVCDAQGRPDPRFFREDALHMKPEGYARWVPLIRKGLEKLARKSRTRGSPGAFAPGSLLGDLAKLRHELIVGD